MGIETISFGCHRAKDTTGSAVPEQSRIPKMRGGRKKVSTNQLIKELNSALEYLADTPCSFWACDGPQRPRLMCTCSKCWAMREVAKVKAALERKL